MNQAEREEILRICELCEKSALMQREADYALRKIDQAHGLMALHKKQRIRLGDAKRYAVRVRKELLDELEAVYGKDVQDGNRPI